MTSDPEAAETCRDLYPRLVGALGLYCGDRAAAEDLAQEALVPLWERWPTPRRPEHPMAWCYRVGVNLARSVTRRRAIEKAVLRRVAVTRQALVAPTGCAPGTLNALTHQAVTTLRQSTLVVDRNTYEDVEHGSS